MMFIEKSSIIYSFKIVTILFVAYMLTTGVIHLKKGFNELESDYELNINTKTAEVEEFNCKTPLFLISFAFILGAFWNQNKMLKFGVI